MAEALACPGDGAVNDIVKALEVANLEEDSTSELIAECFRAYGTNREIMVAVNKILQKGKEQGDSLIHAVQKRGLTKSEVNELKHLLARPFSINETCYRVFYAEFRRDEVVNADLLNTMYGINLNKSQNTVDLDFKFLQLRTSFYLEILNSQVFEWDAPIFTAFTDVYGELVNGWNGRIIASASYLHEVADSIFSKLVLYSSVVDFLKLPKEYLQRINEANFINITQRYMDECLVMPVNSRTIENLLKPWIDELVVSHNIGITGWLESFLKLIDRCSEFTFKDDTYDNYCMLMTYATNFIESAGIRHQLHSLATKMVRYCNATPDFYLDVIALAKKTELQHMTKMKALINNLSLKNIEISKSQ